MCVRRIYAVKTRTRTLVYTKAHGFFHTFLSFHTFVSSVSVHTHTHGIFPLHFSILISCVEFWCNFCFVLLWKELTTMEKSKYIVVAKRRVAMCFICMRDQFSPGLHTFKRNQEIIPTLINTREEATNIFQD